MGIKPIDFFYKLTNSKIEFFTGVPDSLLKEFCLCIDDKVSKKNHIIAANEGNALAIAAGNYLSTGKIPMVYMQNSGLGNAVNPLLSLCDPDVYSIPLLLMIGWRGEPGAIDEPQHIKQGKIQLDLLRTLGVPFEIIEKDDKYINQIKFGLNTAKNNKSPFVFLIRKGTFEKYNKKPKKSYNKGLTRELALEIILNSFDKDTVIVSTTGKASREIFEIRENQNQSHEQDFLTVGSMGHCSSIALGIALSKSKRKVVCLDGDGAFIMHMGILTTIGSIKPKNFYHILLNNKVHESVGGQDTAAKNVDLSAIVDAVGTNNIFSAGSEIDLIKNMTIFVDSTGPSFFEVNIKEGSRKNLGRPTIKPVNNKENFMNFLKD